MSKEYQKAYYVKNRDRLRERHRKQGIERRRKIRLGLIIPKEVIPEFEDWRQRECPVCHDLIFGKPRRTYWKGKIIVIDEGCYLFLRAVDK